MAFPVTQVFRRIGSPFPARASMLQFLVELAHWLSEAFQRAAEGIARSLYHLANVTVPHRIDRFIEQGHHGLEEMRKWRRASQVMVVPLAGTLMLMTSIPAYAANPHTVGSPSYLTYESHMPEGVTFTVSSDSVLPPVTRDAVTVEARPQPAAASGSGIAVVSNPPGPSLDLSAVVAEAMKYVGVPYVYLGSTPDGFDCSGFTSYVYGQLGIGIPHSATAQLAGGIPISEADAIPGDLVYLPGHVGIWLGPGQMIDAPVPGKTVGVHSIWATPTIFRVVS